MANGFPSVRRTRLQAGMQQRMQQQLKPDATCSCERGRIEYAMPELQEREASFLLLVRSTEVVARRGRAELLLAGNSAKPCYGASRGQLTPGSTSRDERGPLACVGEASHGVLRAPGNQSTVFCGCF